MLGYSGPEVIELLSDDDSFVGAADDSVLEVVAAPRQNAWPSSTPRANHTSRVINILTPGTPDTPDLPSPSALLGAPRGRGLSSDSGGSRQALTPTRTHDRLALLVESGSSGIVNCGTLLSRQVALDLPSSPPAIGYNEDLDDSRFLDDIIGRQTEFTDATSETDDRVYAGTAEKERREREKEIQRGISGVNKKQVDQRVLARDMTVVVDPGLLAIFKEPKRATAAPPQPTGAEEPAAAETTSLATPSKEHSIFERLREEEIKYRVEETNAACGIRWEMLVRRKWDSRTNLYVPIACPQVCKVKRAAMVVLSSDRFVELLAKKRVETLLEIWRGALATKRLFVVVVGLQKYLRRAAAVETREFDRQMRSHFKDSVAATAPSSKAKARKQQQQQQQSVEPQAQLSEEAVEEAVLRLQMTLPCTTWFMQCADARELGRLLWQTTMDLALAEFNGDREAALDEGGDFGELTAPATSQPDSTEFITKDVVTALNAAAIRTGTDLADSWIRALTQIPKVTQPVAQSIAAQYPTPKRLFEAWQRLASEAECEQLLAQLLVASATAGGRRLGSAMSTRIYRVFNEPDAGRPFAEL
ncbi:hypothetical protein GGI00_002425 [Coemansia sp. RSA 2681]|nr:hypothetical protein GGI00_002425 [Coemansia sp. RSA 2681]